MRVSIRTSDSGYALHRHIRNQGQRTLVKFNGVHQVSAVTADDEAGVLVRLVDPLMYDAERSAWVDEVVHGKVEIEVIDEVVL